MKSQGITGGSFLFEDPTAAIIMGLCPAIAVSARVLDSLWMSACVLVVLVLSSLCMALVARGRAAFGDAGQAANPGVYRLGALLVTAVLTGCVEIILTAYVPQAIASLGIYAPLIAVNCLVLGGTERAYGSGSIADGVTDAIASGFGFACCLVLIALIREVLGAGTITLFPVGSFDGTVALPGLSQDPVRALGLAGGGLLCLGYLTAIVRSIPARHTRVGDGKVGSP
jgi:Na+-translocating ferredoxin:NAD+ oxidoreductase subunit E